MKKALAVVFVFCTFLSSSQQILQIGAWANNPNFLLEYSQNNIIVSGIGGIRFIDISTPTNPVATSFVSMPVYGFGMKVNGNYLYAGGGASSIFDVIDILNINSPSLTGSTSNVTGQINAIEVKGNYAYAQTSDTLDIINITNKANPTLANKMYLPGINGGMAIYSHYLYISAQTGIVILDITTPSSPTVVNVYGSSYYGKLSLDTINSRIFAGTSSGFEAISISNPTAPSMLFIGGSNAGSISYYNGLIFQTSNSVSVYDVSGGASNYLCGFIGSGSVMDVYARDSVFFLSTVNDIYVLQFSRLVGIKEFSNGKKEIRMSPNPSSQVIEIALNSSEPVNEIKVFNELGEVVTEQKEIVSQHYALDVSQLEAGVYFISIFGSNEIIRGKFIKE